MDIDLPKAIKMARSIIIICICAVLSQGCGTASPYAYEAFDESVSGMIGKPLASAFHIPTGFISTRKPTQIHKLESGNELYVYEDYWGPIDRESCDVFVEVDQSNMVVAAYSQGEGCWRPY